MENIIRKEIKKNIQPRKVVEWSKPLCQPAMNPRVRKENATKRKKLEDDIEESDDDSTSSILSKDLLPNKINKVITPIKFKHSSICVQCKDVINECPEHLFGRHSFLRAKAEMELELESGEKILSLDDIKDTYFMAYQFAFEFWSVQRNDRLPAIEDDVYRDLPLCMAHGSYANTLNCFKKYTVDAINSDIKDKQQRTIYTNEKKDHYEAHV